MNLQTTLAIGAILALLTAVVYGEVYAWNECRETHSWFYCLRTLHGNK